MNILSGFNLPDLSKTSSSNQVQPSQVAPTTQSATGSTTSSSSSKGDQANLSASGLAASASVSGNPDSDVRMQLVQSIQSSIQAGTYNVSSSDVAGSIIQSLLGHNG